jgi:hypothetical protein
VKRERAGSVMRAEGLADLVHRLAGGAEVLPGEVAGCGVPADRLTAAVEDLRAGERRWAAMTPGDEWVQEWPGRTR